jgi:hypothetical protein
MNQKFKIALVVGVGAATLGFLYWEHAAKAPPTGDAGPVATKHVAKPKAHTRRTVANSPTVDVSVASDPFTQLQIDSAAALGFGTGDAPPDTSVPLKEDLAYLGLGDS